jgi:ribonuclease HII
MALADLIAFDAAHGDVVCGADEAGLGSYAGPLVVAAVRLRPAVLNAQTLTALARLNDSKKLSAKARAELYPVVLSAAQSVAICLRSARAIDERGVHVCNLEANQCALARVAAPGAALLADGRRRRGYALEPIAGRDVVHVVGGDRASAAIAAASIIAKVTRDRLMGRLAVGHPGYGFGTHAGYGTKDHERAIARLGLCDQHRRSIKKLARLAAAPVSHSGVTKPIGSGRLTESRYWVAPENQILSGA